MKSLIYHDTNNVLVAFDLYTKLAQHGVAPEEDLQLFQTNNDVYTLLNQFAEKMQCVLFPADNKLYMVPKASYSPFHVSNQYLKKTYLKSGATNSDLYLMYFATIVLLGEFYNSYLTKEPTILFLPMHRWVEAVNERIEVLQQYSEEELKKLEKDLSYNWLAILEKWSALDDIKENVKRQYGQTISRVSFLHTVKQFLVEEEIVKEIGNDEIELSEKAKMIVQRYFMNLDHNNDILQFLYDLQPERDGSDADNF